MSHKIAGCVLHAGPITGYCKPHLPNTYSGACACCGVLAFFPVDAFPLPEAYAYACACLQTRTPFSKMPALSMAMSRRPQAARWRLKAASCAASLCTLHWTAMALHPFPVMTCTCAARKC